MVLLLGVGPYLLCDVTVSYVICRRKDITNFAKTADVTKLIYKQDIAPLSVALSDYPTLSKKEDVWILFDNLDKNWPVSVATSEDIMTLKCLLEATWKLQSHLVKGI